MFAIVKIETKPEYDPYVNLSGHSSQTYLSLDPESSMVWVAQEYKTNSTSMYRWHGRELTWLIPGHPSEENVRLFLANYTPELERIIAGYTCEWDGHNHVGYLNDDARDAKDEIVQMLDNGAIDGGYYQFWETDTWIWMQELDVTADMTDEQLAKLADELNMVAKDDRVIFDANVLDYLHTLRDDARRELIEQD